MNNDDDNNTRWPRPLLMKASRGCSASPRKSFSRTSANVVVLGSSYNYGFRSVGAVRAIT